MSRPILSETETHPAIRALLGADRDGILAEVQAAVARHDVLVVGMRQNPVPKKARKLLAQKGIAHEYLEYGSYLSDWRKRNVLKMWTGWPTFPMIFVKGTFIGGAADLEKLLTSTEFEQLLSAPRPR